MDLNTAGCTHLITDAVHVDKSPLETASQSDGILKLLADLHINER